MRRAFRCAAGSSQARTISPRSSGRTGSSNGRTGRRRKSGEGWTTRTPLGGSARARPSPRGSVQRTFKLRAIGWRRFESRGAHMRNMFMASAVALIGSRCGARQCDAVPAAWRCAVGCDVRRLRLRPRMDARTLRPLPSDGRRLRRSSGLRLRRIQCTATAITLTPAAAGGALACASAAETWI